MKILRIFLVTAICFTLTGCDNAPTYPKETLTQAVVDLCLNEYNIEVESELFGKTLAIFIPLPSLLDMTLMINEEANEIIHDVIFSVTRVVLSTDAVINYYCVIAQDVRMPDFQLIVIKYVNDVKRVYLSDISRGEFYKRSLIDLTINPQSRKEQEIKELMKEKEIFEKAEIDPKIKEAVINDLFRSPPLGVKDFGYWEGRFFVKDITMLEFLSEQISHRVRLRFGQEEDLKKGYLVRSVEASFNDEREGTVLDVSFDINPHEVLVILGEAGDKRVVFENVLREVSDCLYGYSFKDFNLVRVMDVNTNDRILLSRDELFSFKRNRLGIDAIMGGM